jgi:hypothetical protein
VEIKQKTIISLAQAIAQIGKSFGLNPTIDRSQNPRHENAGPEGETKITTDFLKDLENEFSFEKVIRDTLYSVISSKDRIRQELLTPTVDWHGQS